MKKTILVLSFLALTAVSFAQSTARKFQLANSADGNSVVYAYLPKTTSGRAVVDCPGGGYSHLAMDHEGHDWAEYFNKQGIAYFVLKYRMPKGDRNIPLSDAYNALKTVHDSASVWKINPNDIGIMGFSAGGHLASAVSTHADYAIRPAFSILFYPVISMNEKITHKGSCVGFLGEGQKDEKLVKEWSSDKAVRPHLTPRSVLIFANDDGVVPPVTNAISYYSSMRNCGNESSIFCYPMGGHGFGFRTNYAYHDQMLSDLTRWLEGFKAPKADAIRVACIGNSITDGFGIDMSDQKGYPAQLQKKLGQGYYVKNFGVSARTLLNSGDIPYMKEEAWKAALAFNPNVVVIKLGTNDSKPHNWAHKDDFMNDYKQMIDSLKALPSKPAIYICSPIIGDNKPWGISDSVISNEIIPMIVKIAKKNKVNYIDLHSQFKEDKGIMQGDNVHPTAKGAGELANLIFEAITPKKK